MQLAGILRSRRPSVRVMTYALDNKEADVTAFDIKTSFQGTYSRQVRRDRDGNSLSNGGADKCLQHVAALCAALSLNIPIKIIQEGIAMAGLVKGRFEKVDMGQDFLAVVDYAHTEDALERLLLTARQLLEAYRYVGKTEKIMKEKRRQFAIPGRTKENREKKKKRRQDHYRSRVRRQQGQGKTFENGRDRFKVKRFCHYHLGQSQE